VRIAPTKGSRGTSTILVTVWKLTRRRRRARRCAESATLSALDCLRSSKSAPMRTAPEDAALQGAALVYAGSPGFDEVTSIVQGRCAMCHAAEPAWDGVLWPPKGVVLETPAQIAHAARSIYLQAGVSHAMPPANLSFIEPEERAAIVRWFRGAGTGGIDG
jgi:uncharacterized membrane protein